MQIASWHYAESTGEESVYPQVVGRSSSGAFQAVYWRCVAAFFASSRRINPDAEHVLFSNLPRAPIVDSHDVHELLGDLGVRFLQLPYTFKPPEGYFGAWRNQFYVFDIIRSLARYGYTGNSVILDSDCLWIDAATPLDEAITQNHVLTYSVDLPPDYRSNGLTRQEMRTIFAEMLGRPLTSPPVYCGGEIVAASRESLRAIDAELDSVWHEQLDRHERGALKFNEEAQALTYIYYKLGVPLGTANPFIKRIWTGLPGRYSNDSGQDYGLLLWHLPVEKSRGFRRLFAQITDKKSEFWRLPPGPPLASFLGRRMGVANRTFSKSLGDVGEFIGRKLRAISN